MPQLSILGDGRVVVPRDVLAIVAGIAGAVEEQGSAERDKFGRVPSRANPLVAQGLEREPVVSQAAVALRDAVARAAGRRPVRLTQPWPDRRRWAVALTHDVDVVEAWPLFTSLRLAELLRKGEYARASAAARAAARALFDNPAARGVADVLEAEGRHAAVATWFFICGTRTAASFARGDVTYKPEGRAARALVRQVLHAGHEVGLHGSFETLDDATLLREQRARLAKICEIDVAGVRQHFLRMRPGETQRAMLDAGFRYDATYGFADRNGFRLGAADVVPAWSAPRGEREGIDLVPLVWMDRALSKYAGIEDPQAWIADALELAEQARAVEGLWSGLWHPNLTPALGYPGAPAAYAALVGTLPEQASYIASLRSIVEWRAARRAVRITRFAEDGRTELAASRSDIAIPLEDERGVVNASVLGPT